MNAWYGLQVCPVFRSKKYLPTRHKNWKLLAEKETDGRCVITTSIPYLMMSLLTYLTIR